MMKKMVSIVPITLSLCGVIICAIFTYGAMHKDTCQYRVGIIINKEGLQIKSDIDKTECKLADSEQKRLD